MSQDFEGDMFDIPEEQDPESRDDDQDEVGQDRTGQSLMTCLSYSILICNF